MGAKPGGMKGNEQKAEYEEPGKKARETRPERMGKAKEVKTEGAHRRRPTVRGKREERGKEETEAK